MATATKHKRRIRLGGEDTNPLYTAWLACGLVQDQWGGWTPKDWRDNRHMEQRHQLILQYSWAVPSPGALVWAVERCPRVVEIGAGRGYWAKLLTAAGCDVVAYDQSIHDTGEIVNNQWHTDGPPLFPVEHGYSDRAAAHGDRTLFLCWPPYDDPMAADSLNAYAGREMLFVGEGDGGCCGDARFWDLVSKNWEEIGECHIPQWPCIHDWMWLYRRK